MNINIFINRIQTTIMTDIKKYLLTDFDNIKFGGFDYVLETNIIKIISELALQVGSPDYVKTPIFTKRENFNNITNTNINSKDNYGMKRRRGNRNNEMCNNEYCESSSFQPTKIEEKSHNSKYIDNIRMNLNKLTDKNVLETKNKIIHDIDKILEENKTKEEMNNITKTIFDIASLNRFYSEIYADLYSTLINKYEIFHELFEENLVNFMDLFNNIEYIDPSVDYDKFCKINKDNEKRKSLAAFYKNLSKKGIIQKEKIIEITQKLLSMVYTFISEENKKNEVDELMETIAILYDKSLEDEYNYIIVGNNISINEFIEKISHSKVKDYKSLTNKTIFKCMDLIDVHTSSHLKRTI